jgi:hypothetical protein
VAIRGGGALLLPLDDRLQELPDLRKLFTEPTGYVPIRGFGSRRPTGLAVAFLRWTFEERGVVLRGVRLPAAVLPPVSAILDSSGVITHARTSPFID